MPSHLSYQHVIQVAGIIDQAEAAMLVGAGVDFLGFPLRLPIHREDIDEAGAGAIMRSLVPPHFGVLITYLDHADAIAELCAELGASIVQLHGDITTQELRELKRGHPDLRIIKSVIVGERDLDLSVAIDEPSRYVDAFITDTYDPATGASGATGKAHDWGISQQVVSYTKHPVILAGGLTPDNVGRAISVVRPAGVDVHTGVEDSEGRKDTLKVRAFVDAARRAFEEL